MSAQEAPVTWQSVAGDPTDERLDRIELLLEKLSEDVASLRNEQVITSARLLALFEALR